MGSGNVRLVDLTEAEAAFDHWAQAVEQEHPGEPIKIARNHARPAAQQFFASVDAVRAQRELASRKPRR